MSVARPRAPLQLREAERAAPGEPREPREYLSLDKAADRLGWCGKWRGERLQRTLLAKERRTGIEVMARLGGEGQGRRYGVSMQTLRRYCRELFIKPPKDLVPELKRHLESIDQRVADIVETTIAPQLEELRAADYEIAEGVGNLAKRVDDLSKRVGESRRESARPPQG